MRLLSTSEDRKEKTIGTIIYAIASAELVNLMVIIGAFQGGQHLAAEFFAILGGIFFVIGVVYAVHLARKKDWN